MVRSEILTRLGESGIVIVLDNDSPPQPNAVAVIITDPDHPSAQFTRPVTELIEPADSLFHDHVTLVLDEICFESPFFDGQLGKVKGS